MEAIQELFQFLDINSRVDLKTVALENILGLTGSPDGIQLLTSSKSTIFDIVQHYFRKGIFHPTISRRFKKITPWEDKPPHGDTLAMEAKEEEVEDVIKDI